MTKTITILLIVLTGELMVRQGLSPLKLLADAATGAVDLR